MAGRSCFVSIMPQGSTRSRRLSLSSPATWTSGCASRVIVAVADFQPIFGKCAWCDLGFIGAFHSGCNRRHRS
jgi:hypothetical protein